MIVDSTCRNDSVSVTFTDEEFLSFLLTVYQWPRLKARDFLARLRYMATPRGDLDQLIDHFLTIKK